MGPKDRLERFLKHLDRVFQREPTFFPIKNVTDRGPEIVCLVYRDCPEPGFVTGVTWGLSEAPQVEHTKRGTELVISVQSDGLQWPLAAAELVRQLRGDCPFCYGDVIGFGGPIAEDSDMTAFVVWGPSIFDQVSVQDMNVGDRVVSLHGLVPIHDSERRIVRGKGLKALWFSPGFDLYDVGRPPVAPQD